MADPLMSNNNLMIISNPFKSAEYYGNADIKAAL